MEKQYLNKLCVIIGRLNDVLAREAKGKSKPACYLEFETAEGIVSARLSNPMQKRDFYTIAKFMGTLGKPVMVADLEKGGQTRIITSLRKYIGEELMLVVTPFEWAGKAFFSVTDFANIKFGDGGVYEEQAGNADSDEILF